MLKMIVVHVQGAVTLPNEESIICTNWLGLDEAHVNENHNAFPDDLPVDSTTVAFKLNLIDNCLRNVLFSVIKDSFPKHAMTLLADQLHLILLQVIPVPGPSFRGRHWAALGRKLSGDGPKTGPKLPGSSARAVRHRFCLSTPA